MGVFFCATDNFMDFSWLVFVQELSMGCLAQEAVWY